MTTTNRDGASSVDIEHWMPQERTLEFWRQHIDDDQLEEAIVDFRKYAKTQKLSTSQPLNNVFSAWLSNRYVALP